MSPPGFSYSDVGFKKIRNILAIDDFSFLATLLLKMRCSTVLHYFHKLSKSFVLNFCLINNNFNEFHQYL